MVEAGEGLISKRVLGVSYVQPYFVSFKNSDQVMNDLGINLIASKGQSLDDTL